MHGYLRWAPPGRTQEEPKLISVISTNHTLTRTPYICDGVDMASGYTLAVCKVGAFVVLVIASGVADEPWTKLAVCVLALLALVFMVKESEL